MGFLRKNRDNDGAVKSYDPNSYKAMHDDVEGGGSRRSSLTDDSTRRGSHRGRFPNDTSNSHLKYEGYDPGLDGPRKPADTDEDLEVYIVRQSYGYCSILFSIAQTVILALMMWQCGVAPMSLNPMIGPYPDALSEWGGKNSVLILEDGETYRLLTPIFLHAGVIHLLGNVAVQLETGVFFEKEWGSIRWLIIYIASAFGSSILSTIFMPTAVSVGSSGAVMGLFGGKLAEIMLRACERVRSDQDRVAHEVRKEQCCAVSCSVIIIMAFSFIPFVDWAAHLGGVVMGFLVGIMIFSFDVEGYCFKLFWFGIGTFITVATFVKLVDYMYSGNVELIEELRDVCGYYKENFEDYECNCMRDEYLNNGGDDGRRNF